MIFIFILGYTLAAAVIAVAAILAYRVSRALTTRNTVAISHSELRAFQNARRDAAARQFASVQVNAFRAMRRADARRRSITVN